ncbi:MAG: hypothetical protein NC517_10000 [Firmicutes bacterium]|nr:hypothetical protein [Bacillota bacterium]
MDTPTIVNIILCILSFILAAISVITVVLTLWQNNKMIESSTRPYVVVYSAIKNYQLPVCSLCVKNFGQSGAHISRFDRDQNLAKYSLLTDRVPFDHLCGAFIAPGQSFICNLDSEKLPLQPCPLTFSVEYTLNGKKYSDTFTIEIRAMTELPRKKYSADDPSLPVIEYTLQEIADSFL